jgi:hypothetical protein
MSLENLCKNLQGHVVHVRIKSTTPSEKAGIIYIGVLHGFTLQKGGMQVVLYKAKKLNDPLMLPMEQPLEISPKELLEISYTYIQGVHEGGNIKCETISENRDLVSWEGDDREDIGELLDTGNSKSAEWDQFAVNEKQFGVKSSYTDDNSAAFTVALNRDTKEYKEQLREADRLAREIETQGSTNVHMIEERTGILFSDQTEEERYSSVPRNQQPQQSQKSPQSQDGQKKGSYVLPQMRKQQDTTNNKQPSPQPQSPTQSTQQKETATTPTEATPTSEQTENAGTEGGTKPGKANLKQFNPSLDVSALNLVRPNPQVSGKVISDFQQYEQSESVKNKPAKNEMIENLKKWSETTQNKLEKKKSVTQQGKPVQAAAAAKKNAEGQNNAAVSSLSTQPSASSPNGASEKETANTSSPHQPSSGQATPEKVRTTSGGLSANGGKLNPHASEFRPATAYQYNSYPVQRGSTYPIPMYDSTAFGYPNQAMYLNPYMNPYAMPHGAVYSNPYSLQLQQQQPKQPGQASPQAVSPQQSPQQPNLIATSRVFVPSGVSIQTPQNTNYANNKK